MRWAAVLIAVVLVSGCAAGISATTGSLSVTSAGSGDDCEALLTDQEAIAREILSYETDAPIYDQATWESGVARADETLALLRTSFAPANVRAEYSASSKIQIAASKGELYQQLRMALGGTNSVTHQNGEPTGIAAIDSLSDRYGSGTVLLYDVHDTQNNLVASICLNRRANFRQAVGELDRQKALLGFSQVYRSDSSPQVGDAPSLNMAERNGDLFAVVREAGGDCPAGCTVETLSVFQIHGNEVWQFSDGTILADSFLVDLVASVRWPRPPWRGNGVNYPAVPKSTPAVTPVTLPETGGPPMPLLSPQ